MTHSEIQADVICKYRIDICDGTKCSNDWQRTHAHVKERRVCKWKKANSIQSTFTLLHEVGHIMTTTSKMRRAESEYHATVWAIEKAEEYGITIPQSIIDRYQRYIDMELDRGKRRGGSGYGSLKLQKEFVITMTNPRTGLRERYITQGTQHQAIQNYNEVFAPAGYKDFRIEEWRG